MTYLVVLNEFSVKVKICYLSWLEGGGRDRGGEVETDTFEPGRDRLFPLAIGRSIKVSSGV